MHVTALAVDAKARSEKCRLRNERDNYFHPFENKLLFQTLNCKIKNHRSLTSFPPKNSVCMLQNKTNKQKIWPVTSLQTKKEHEITAQCHELQLSAISSKIRSKFVAVCAPAANYLCKPEQAIAAALYKLY